ncbi:MAG: neutral/alkaline non-lysosomal ceramidase N-terminal domain-containing protein [Myxococcales bacterium]|nr:neutral/alkaline non-lysosomal ceramidase N-terminal domain-containing protein [Myxococcales bacterium]
MRALRLVALFLVLVACDGPTTEDAGTPPPPMDAGFDANEPPPRVREELPAPDALRAGVAVRRIPAPLGIGTMGFGAIGEDPNPTPFSEMFPGTNRMYGSLTFRAVALSRGEAFEVVLVRMDTVGVFQQLREAVLDELESRTGRRFDDALVLAGNHTHSGPGRMLMTTGSLVALGDYFFPEFYDHIVAALADVVQGALADLAPAELGFATAETSIGHHDRRCENDSLDQIQESPDMPLIAVRREGRLDALVASYAYHGTVLGIGDLTLSGDFGSVVEQKIEERFDHPVTVLFFNSWGADMAPGDAPEAPGVTGPMQPGGFDRMERTGDAVADVVVPVVEAMSYSSDVPVRARTYRVPLSTAVIGYPAGVFNYPHGGAFCGIGGDGNCMDSTPIEGLDRRCVPISARENLPKQTMLTAGQIGDHWFVTAPGEWSTALAASVLDHVRDTSGSADAMFIGYANDYTGYSVSEVDWWQGGYEASGALWGPRQGDYLADRLREAFDTFHDQWTEPPWWQPVRVEPFSGYDGYDLYVAEGAVGAGTIASDVAATVTGEDVVSFTIQGSDPWLGAPEAVLEQADGTPVLKANGVPVTSESYDLWRDLAVSPTYADVERAETRTFSWTFHFPVTRRTRTGIPALSGDYRFRVRVPMAGGEPMEITTGTFTVE